ncbi:MAG: DivIVA domain-containing protein [Ilumatobacteraceae bacterium]
MALDFQRPDPSSPAAVASAQFTVTRRGYREEEVRDFLRQVSVELARLLERERFLQNELQALQSRGAIDVATVDEATITELLGAEAARVLSAAREAAQAMRDRAAESAEQIVREASREATRLLEESKIEASRRRSDVSSEAEQELELAKQQGREMVAEVRAYRERVLADLAKRTEEARRELERLVHERERLLSAFERARHAATDVVGDLEEFDEAIRETGIVPPLASPDAPPPPRPIGKSDTPIFDAKQYEDELGTATGTVGEVVDEVVDETSPTEPELHGLQPTESLATESESSPAPSSELESAEYVEPEPTASASNESESKLSESNEARADEPPSQERMAPVVNIFDRQRRKNAGSEPSTTPQAASPLTPQSRAPEHPVFERVEAQPDARPDANSDAQSEASIPTSTPSRVDEIFERLRSSSTQRVATKTENDLAERTSGESSTRTSEAETPQKSDSKPPRSKDDTESKAVRPRPVDPSIFRRRDEVIDAVAEKMKRAAKRVIADDENAVLTHVGTKRSSLTLEAMLPNHHDHAQRFVDGMREELTSIAVDGARSLSDSRRADVLKSVTTGGVLESVTSFIVNDLIRPLHERIASAIEQSSGDRDELLKRVRGEFAEWKSQRLETVVVDAAHLAYARGLFVGCEQSSHVCWAVDPNGPACADAEDNALAGRVRRGEAFPTGHDRPLAHAGCRCLVVPLDK